MSEDAAKQIYEKVDAIYRSDSRRVLAPLIRLLGDFDLAEEAVQNAFTAAVDQWPREGLPANPRAWLVSTGRFKAIDALRRRARFDSSFRAALGRLLPTLPSKLDGGGIFRLCQNSEDVDSAPDCIMHDRCGCSEARWDQLAQGYFSRYF